MRTAPPPSIVTVLPPSMTVSIVVGSSIVFVTVIVAGAEPQSNVTMPPAVSAADSFASVHDAAVPVPTTVVGLLVSTAVMGAVHTAGGGGTLPPSTLGGGMPASVAPSARVMPPSLPGPEPELEPELEPAPESPPPGDPESPPVAGELPDEDNPQATAQPSARNGTARRMR